MVQLKMPENSGSSRHKLKMCGASTAKTPVIAPNLDELTSLSSSSGPVKDTEGATAYLVQKALITSINNTTMTKLANILFTVALESKITEDIASTIKAVGFLMMHKLIENTSTVLATSITEKLATINAATNNSLKWECVFIKATTAEQSKHILSITDTIKTINACIHNLNASNLAVVTVTKELQPAIQAITDSIPHIITITDSAKNLTKSAEELRKVLAKCLPLLLLFPQPISHPTYTNMVNNHPPFIC